MSAAVTVEEGQLPAAFQQGLEAVRRLVPNAAVVALHENFGVIDLGDLSKDDLGPYTQPSGRLFARAPLTFPNAAPYGLISAPFLTRKDGAAVEREHLDHPSAAPIAAYLGKTGLGFWSWDWSNMPLRRPEDLAAIVPWAHKRIRQG